MSAHVRKITFAEMRATGERDVAGLLQRLSVQPFDLPRRRSMADDIRLSDIEPRFVCAACGVSHEAETCGAERRINGYNARRSSF